MNGIRNSDETSLNLLLRKYKYYAKTLANSLCFENNANMHYADDLASVGLESVMVALRNYNFIDKFFPYWCIIAEREMIKYLMKDCRTTYSVSLDSNFKDGDTSFHDVIADIDKERDDSLFESFLGIVNDKKNTLDEKERFIVSHYLSGYSITEISKISNMSRSSIYYHYNSAIKKIREILLETK